MTIQNSKFKMQNTRLLSLGFLISSFLIFNWSAPAQRALFYRTNDMAFSPTNMMRSNVMAGAGIAVAYGANGGATVSVTNAVVSPFGVEIGVPFRLFCITNNVTVTNTTVATSLLSNLNGTATIPANFWRPGMSVTFIGGGGSFSPGSGILGWTNELKMGGTRLGTNCFPLPTGLANTPTIFHWTISCLSTGASGVFTYFGGVDNNLSAASATRQMRGYSSVADTVTLDTTGALTIDMIWHTPNTTVAVNLRSGYAMVIP